MEKLAYQFQLWICKHQGQLLHSCSHKDLPQPGWTTTHNFELLKNWISLPKGVTSYHIYNCRHWAGDYHKQYEQPLSRRLLVIAWYNKRKRICIIQLSIVIWHICCIFVNASNVIQLIRLLQSHFPKTFYISMLNNGRKYQNHWNIGQLD